MSAGLSGAMKAGTPPINSIASTRAPIQSGIASDLRIAVGGSARIRFQIFFPRAVATLRPDGAAPDEFGHRRVQSVCGADPRDVTVEYAQAYLRPVLAPWPNQAPMLMRAHSLDSKKASSQCLSNPHAQLHRQTKFRCLFGNWITHFGNDRIPSTIQRHHGSSLTGIRDHLRPN